jgi:hypothetical protein
MTLAAAVSLTPPDLDWLPSLPWRKALPLVPHLPSSLETSWSVAPRLESFLEKKSTCKAVQRINRKLKKARANKRNGKRPPVASPQVQLPSLGYQMSRPTVSIQKAEASDSSQTYSLSPTDLEYISVVTDPFNQGRGGSFMAREARIPDSYSGLSISLVLYAKGTFSGATSTHVHVRATCPTTSSVIGETVYAANETDATLTASVAQYISTSSPLAMSF